MLFLSMVSLLIDRDRVRPRVFQNCRKANKGIEANIYILGHIHNLGTAIYKQNNKLFINASVEHWNYKPISLMEILQYYEQD
jgi:calcineurin-like phosphoesterase family protein